VEREVRRRKSKRKGIISSKGEVEGIKYDVLIVIMKVRRHHWRRNLLNSMLLPNLLGLSGVSAPS